MVNDDTLEFDNADKILDTTFQGVTYRCLIYLNKLNGSYASQLSTKANTTYSHAVKMMNRLEDLGLVTAQKKGRKKEYELTEQGQALADKLVEIDDMVGSTVGEDLSNGRSVQEIVNESAK